MTTAKNTIACLGAYASVAALSLGLATGAFAETLNFSVGLGPGSTVVQDVEAYAKKIEEWSEGDLKIKVFPLSLVGLPEMAPGVRDGLTDIGYMAAPYFPTEFAHTNFLAEQTMMMALLDPPDGKEGAVYAGAISDFILNECDKCLDEYKVQNHVYMGHMSTSPYVLLCREPVTDTASLAGKRLRAGSAAYRRFAEHFDAVGVQMPASEAYEALSQGVLDCGMMSAGDLTNYRIIEVTKAVTLGVPGNVYGGTVIGNINRDVWQGLTDEKREILLRGTSWLGAHMTWSYLAQQERDLKTAREQGIEVSEADPALMDELKTFVEADQKVVADLFKQNYGIENASEMQEAFKPYLDKWIALMKDVESADALNEVYWNELYSKLDPTSYGMN